MKTVFRTLFKTLLLSVGLSLIGISTTESRIVNREYQLKTAYLFHFAELTEWPDAISSVTICYQGDTPLQEYLPVLEGRQVHDRTVHVIRSDGPSFEQCQILVLSAADVLTKTLLEKAHSRHVLLVSDADNFARNGGMIQFTIRDNRLKLVVNLPSVKRAGLKLSSKLLRMAEILE